MYGQLYGVMGKGMIEEVDASARLNGGMGREMNAGIDVQWNGGSERIGGQLVGRVDRVIG